MLPFQHQPSPSLPGSSREVNRELALSREHKAPSATLAAPTSLAGTGIDGIDASMDTGGGLMLTLD